MASLLRGTAKFTQGSTEVVLNGDLDASYVTGSTLIFVEGLPLPLECSDGKDNKIFLSEPWSDATVENKPFVVSYTFQAITRILEQAHNLAKATTISSQMVQSFSQLLTSTDPTVDVTIDTQGTTETLVPYPKLVQAMQEAIAGAQVVKFSDLSDTPDYVDNGGKALIINGLENGLTVINLSELVGQPVDTELTLETLMYTETKSLKAALDELYNQNGNGNGNGSSGGGVGLPINAAYPLYVGDVDEYTAPDGTVWLKTGYQSTDLARFPDATQIAGKVGLATAKTDSISGLPVYVRCK